MFCALPFPFFTFGHFGTNSKWRAFIIHLRTLLDSTYKVDKHIAIMKYLLLPLIAILLATTGTALADNNSNSVTSTSTQSTSVNGHGSETTTTSHDGGPPHVVTHTFHGFHSHVVIVHEPSQTHTIIIHKSSGATSNQNIPIVFVKGAGFVAPINCQLNSKGDKIVCDFEQVQIN